MLKKNKRNQASHFEGVISLIDFEIDRTYPSSFTVLERKTQLFVECFITEIFIGQQTISWVITKSKLRDTFKSCSVNFFFPTSTSKLGKPYKKESKVHQCVDMNLLSLTANSDMKRRGFKAPFVSN